MDHLVHDLGFNPHSATSVFILLAIYTVLVITIIWIAGIFKGDHSFIDAYYGFGYAIPAVFAFTIAHATSATAAVLLVMAMAHGCRLGYYLLARYIRYLPVHGGDPRYLRFAQDFSPGYWWKSFFRVTEPQGVVIVLIGSPAVAGILLTAHSHASLGILAFAGLAVFGIGLYFESLGDGQLQAFLELDPRPRYLNTGVWKFTRHPNYFGTTTVWWGVWLVALSADSRLWWTVIGPVANTILLNFSFGSKFQDTYMGTRPEYRKLMARTRKTFPIPLSAAKIAANEERIATAVDAAQTLSDEER